MFQGEADTRFAVAGFQNAPIVPGKKFRRGATAFGFSFGFTDFRSDDL